MQQVDFGHTAQDYRRFRAGFPPELFARLATFGIGLRGQKILDSGTGTGTLARGFARQNCDVTGLDPSEAMLAQARILDTEAGVRISYCLASAEQTGLQDAQFDVVTAGQCWHWFRRDQAAREAWRVLRHGGALVLTHFDWLPLRGNIAEATEQLILQHNPQWQGAGGCGVHPEQLTDLAEAGFSSLESFTFDLPVFYSHEGWRGRIRASAGVAASLGAHAVSEFDKELAALLRRIAPSDPSEIPHRVWVLIGRKLSATANRLQDKV